MDWWESFAKTMSTPDWWAGLVQAFVGSAVAFVGALLLVLRQLQHDRALVQEQLAAMALDRTAEKRAVAAGVLGGALIDAVELYDEMLPDEVVELIRDRQTDAPGSDEIYRAEHHARLTLDLDSTVLDLWRELNHTWRVSQTIAGEGGTSDEDDTYVFLGTFGVLDVVRDRIDRLGRALVRWDGIGKIPSAEVLEGWLPVAVTDKIEYSNWTDEVRTLFDYCGNEIRRARGNKKRSG